MENKILKRNIQLQCKQNNSVAAAVTEGRGCNLQRWEMFSALLPYNLQILNQPYEQNSTVKSVATLGVCISYT